MDAIAFLAVTASNRDTYLNISGTVASLMSELVIFNKNLVKTLKENTLLEQVLSQCQQLTGGTGSSRATMGGGTSQ